jgi:hypothetical protein
MTNWELHKHGNSTWVVANCDRCHYGATFDIGELRQRAADIVLSYGDKPMPPDALAGIPDARTLRFTHCRISESIPEKILNGEEIAIVEKPLQKVQFI